MNSNNPRYKLDASQEVPKKANNLALINPSLRNSEIEEYKSQYFQFDSLSWKEKAYYLSLKEVEKKDFINWWNESFQCFLDSKKQQRIDYLKSYWKSISQKGQDRHLIPKKVRYRLAIFKREIIKRGWIVVSKPIKKELNLFVDKKILSYNNSFFRYKAKASRFVFCWFTSQRSSWTNQIGYTFKWYWQHYEKELLELLVKSPRSFIKKLEFIDNLVLARMNLNPESRLQIVVNEKVPVKGKNYSADGYREIRSVASLLFSYGCYGKIVREKELLIDLDALNKEHPLYHQQQEKFKQIVTYFRKHKLAREIVRSQSGDSYHLYLSSFADCLGSKVYWNTSESLISGDAKGKGGYAVGAGSIGYDTIDINFDSYIFANKDEIAKHLKKFNFAFTKEEVCYKIFKGKQHSTKVIDFAPSDWTYADKPFKAEQVKIVSLQPVLHRGYQKMFGRCSREVNYFLATVQDSQTQKSLKFLIDEGYRPRLFRNIEKAKQEQIPLNLMLKQGQKHTFIEREIFY